MLFQSPAIGCQVPGVPPGFPRLEHDVGRPLLCPPLEAFLPVFIERSPRPRRDAHHYSVRRDVGDDHRPGADHGIRADAHVRAKNRIAADDTVILDHDWSEYLQVGHLVPERPDRAVMRHEGYFFRNRHMVADFYEVWLGSDVGGNNEATLADLRPHFPQVFGPGVWCVLPLLERCPDFAIYPARYPCHCHSPLIPARSRKQPRRGRERLHGRLSQSATASRTACIPASAAKNALTPRRRSLPRC